VLLASTGVIGVPLAVDKLTAGLPQAFARLSPEGFLAASQAILTTDTRPKIAARKCGKARVLGFAKGAGMIQPRMKPQATMLAFVVTDAAATPAVLGRLTAASVEQTFNRISVDGDTSTNDTVFVLANGAAGAVPPARLARALEEVMMELAVAIAADGEGARKLVHIRVTGARHDREAETVARAIANSPLVKTALAGGDPNWGRILSAAGASGAPILPARVRVTLQGVRVCRRGAAVEFDEAALGRTLAADSDIRLDVDLGRGSGRARFWTCDLTEEYIRINASYRT
jgi:glutamate N-acetyltransferase/amino-acid N-acetyltransferase